MVVLHEVLARGCTLKAAGLCKQLQLTFVHGLSFTGLTVSVLCVSRSRLPGESEKHAGALSLRSVPASEQEILRPKTHRVDVNVELCSAIRIALIAPCGDSISPLGIIGSERPRRIYIRSAQAPTEARHGGSGTPTSAVLSPMMMDRNGTPPPHPTPTPHLMPNTIPP